jgi:hypothetical protein
MPGFSREGRKPNRGGRLSRLWIIVSLAEHNGNDQATIPRTIEPFGRSPSRLAYHCRGNAVLTLRLGVPVQLLIGQADEIAQCFLYARVFYALQQFAIAQDFGAQLCRIIVAHLPRKCGELGASSRPRLGLMREFCFRGDGRFWPSGILGSRPRSRRGVACQLSRKVAAA